MNALLIRMDGLGGEYGLGGKCIVAGALSGVSRPGVALAGAVCARLAGGAETRREFIAGAASSPIDDDALAGAVVFLRRTEREVRMVWRRYNDGVSALLNVWQYCFGRGSAAFA